MPAEVRLFIRTSLVCLILTVILAGVYYSWTPLRGDAPPCFLLPTHMHLGMVGWLANMVFGVALWMFPVLPNVKLLNRVS